jgi:hypothetical protein
MQSGMRNRRCLMNCSNCGRSLEGVAHVQNDQLLCDDCFAKQESENGKLSPHVTVPVGSEDENIRLTASSAGENGTPFLVSHANANSNEASPIRNNQDSILARLLTPGESVLWKRSFSKGIFKRHLTYTEAVTNLRAVCIDDETGSVVRYAPLESSQVSVENERRIYSGVHSGYSRSGIYTGVSQGQNEQIGNLSFVHNGAVAVTFYNLKDPAGLKQLVLASKRSQF